MPGLYCRGGRSCKLAFLEAEAAEDQVEGLLLPSEDLPGADPTSCTETPAATPCKRVDNHEFQWPELYRRDFLIVLA